MKYKSGDILLLYSGKTVSIIAVDAKSKQYRVMNVDDSEEIFLISEQDVFQYLT